MNYSRFASLAKFGIIIFILIAVYRTNGEKIKAFFSQIFHSVSEVTQVLSEEEVEDTAADKPTNKTTDSQAQTDGRENTSIGNKLNNLFNKLLENPNFRSLVERVLQNSMHRQGTIIENDPAFERIIIHDSTVGKGLEASCGDKVSLKYNLYKVLDVKRNPNIKDKQKQAANIIIGEGKLHMGIENSLIAMKEKGARTTIFLNNLEANSLLKMQGQGGQNIMATDIELVKVITKQKASGIIVHSTRNAKPGTLLPLCGEKINFTYYIEDINGNILYEDDKQKHNVELQIGPKMPKEVIQAIMSTPVDKMSLTIIATPNKIIKAFKGKNLFFPKNFQYPKDQLVVINLAAVSKPA